MDAAPLALCQCGKKLKHFGPCIGKPRGASGERTAKKPKILAAIATERPLLEAKIQRLRNEIKRAQDDLLTAEAKLEALRSTEAAYAEPLAIAAPAVKPVSVPFRMGERR